MPEPESENMPHADRVDALPQWAQKLIGDLRKESADRRTEVRSLQEEITSLKTANSHLQELTDEAEKGLQEKSEEYASLQQVRLKERLLHERSLPLDLVRLVVGDDEDAMREAADSLAELRGAQTEEPAGPRYDPAQAAEDAEDPRDALARQVFGG